MSSIPFAVDFAIDIIAFGMAAFSAIVLLWMLAILAFVNLARP